MTIALFPNQSLWWHMTRCLRLAPVQPWWLALCSASYAVSSTGCNVHTFFPLCWSYPLKQSFVIPHYNSLLPQLYPWSTASKLIGTNLALLAPPQLRLFPESGWLERRSPCPGREEGHTVNFYTSSDLLTAWNTQIYLLETSWNYMVARGLNPPEFLELSEFLGNYREKITCKCKA